MSDTHVSGHCYCGGVHFEVTLPEGAKPLFAAYCHCENCRRSHAAPLYQVACVDDSQFTVTQGEDLVVPFQKTPGKVVRAFCGTCGTRVFNTFPNWRPGGRVPVAWFPSLLADDVQRDLPETLRPNANMNAEGCVLYASPLAEMLA